ncbi:MAG: hypothetical protein ACR2GJ_03120 [Gemmatimonadaceae bacterium]
MMFVREMRLSTGNKLVAILAGTVLLVVVGVFLAFGFVLILALAAAGLLLGIGAALYRRLTGRPPVRSPVPRTSHGLDPALEVTPASVRLDERSDRPRVDAPRSRNGDDLE